MFLWTALLLLRLAMTEGVDFDRLDSKIDLESAGEFITLDSVLYLESSKQDFERESEVADSKKAGDSKWSDFKRVDSEIPLESIRESLWHSKITDKFLELCKPCE